MMDPKFQFSRQSSLLQLLAGLLALTLLAVGTLVAQSTKSPDHNQAERPMKFFDSQLDWIEQTMESAAEAMPEEKFSYVPQQGEYKGVRNFGQQIKHAAGTNYALFAAILREKPPVDLGPDGDGPAAMKSKAEIVKFLKDSFAYGHKAMKTITAANIDQYYESPSGPKGSNGGFAVVQLTHTWDIYGQIVEYLRLNGIVPPASRPA
jgi:hypothetical protein